MLDHTGDTYRIIDPYNEPGATYDYILGDGVSGIGSCVYRSLHTDLGNGGNYIPVLNPGESIQIQMGWIVDENQLSQLYLTLDTTSEGWEFNDSLLQAGVIKLKID
ncbi:MAG: hypothetical protein Q4B85_03410 [Lachnospiraceae bacterium]|nr:hypothetical protein [Lachnospiraceae bacterium]